MLALGARADVGAATSCWFDEPSVRSSRRLLVRRTIEKIKELKDSYH